jgi:hypothetical protein
MQRFLSLAAVLAACATASGCTQFSQAIGAEKVAPDEFRVVTRAPLSTPPDFGLRPPRPGDPRPAELRGDAAKTSVFGQDRGVNASPAEKALIARAGAEAVDANIRNQVDFEGAAIVRKPEAFADRVLTAGSPTDQAPEAQRTAEAESARRATGGAEVTIRQADPDRFKLPGL